MKCSKHSIEDCLQCKLAEIDQAFMSDDEEDPTDDFIAFNTYGSKSLFETISKIKTKWDLIKFVCNSTQINMGQHGIIRIILRSKKRKGVSPITLFIGYFDPMKFIFAIEEIRRPESIELFKLSNIIIYASDLIEHALYCIKDYIQNNRENLKGIAKFLKAIVISKIVGTSIQESYTKPLLKLGQWISVPESWKLSIGEMTPLGKMIMHFLNEHHKSIGLKSLEISSEKNDACFILNSKLTIPMCSPEMLKKFLFEFDKEPGLYDSRELHPGALIAIVTRAVAQRSPWFLFQLKVHGSIEGVVQFMIGKNVTVRILNNGSVMLGLRGG